MSLIKYNKLVRDKIPQIIEQDNKKCTLETLSDESYITYLDNKLEEELAEYQENKSLEELADLLEVVYSVAEARGFSIRELEQVRQEKAEKRGRFTKKICLKEVMDND